MAGELLGDELSERTGDEPRFGLVGDELLLGEESGEAPWIEERRDDDPLRLSGELCTGGVSCGEELLLRRVSGDAGVGLERRGGTGEVAGLDEAELGLEGRLEWLDDLLPELSREFLLKRPVLRRRGRVRDIRGRGGSGQGSFYAFQKVTFVLVIFHGALR